MQGYKSGVNILAWTTFLLVQISLAKAARILIISTELTSHSYYFHAAAEGLVFRGHEVYTVLNDQNPQRLLDSLPKLGIKPVFYHLPPNDSSASREHFENQLHTDLFVLNKSNMDLGTFSSYPLKQTKHMMADSEFLENVRTLKIDIAIVDAWALGKTKFVLPVYLDIPYIALSSFFDKHQKRCPGLASFVPMSARHLGFTDNMKFTQRLVNLLTEIVLRVFAYIPGNSDTELITKYIQPHYPHLTTLTDLVMRSQLHFNTKDYILEWPQPLLPNVIPVPCITCRPGKTLPSEYQMFLKNCRHDVILLSFGSGTKLLPKTIVATFLEAFHALPQFCVIWKIAATQLKSKDAEKELVIPRNVFITEWVPQNDILAHEMVKLFITHCGNNGQYESLYHAVPMLGFPLFAEQHYNAKRMKRHRYGTYMDIRSFTPEELVDNIKTVINDKHVKDKVQRASRLLKTRPKNATELIAFWTEHVLRFGGNFTRSAAFDMPWYKFWMVDFALLFGCFVNMCMCLCILRKSV